MKTDLQPTNERGRLVSLRYGETIEVEYRLQHICPGCGLRMNLSRVINWPDGGQSLVFECRRCLVAVNETPLHRKFGSTQLETKPVVIRE